MKSEHRLVRLSAALAVLAVVALLEGEAALANAPIIYPASGQSMQQQAADENQCRGWAQQQTGVSPYSTPPEYYSSGYSSPSVVGTAARGAAVGAVGGAIAGDAGKGAAIGAGVGATAGFMRKNQERRQQTQVNQQAQAQYQASLGNYNNAFGACMQGRGYVVK